MRIASDGIAAAAHQDVQVCAEVRLLHVIDVEPGPAACGTRRFAPFAAAALQFGFVDVEVQPASRYIEFDEVAGAYQRQGATDGGLGGYAWGLPRKKLLLELEKRRK